MKVHKTFNFPNKLRTGDIAVDEEGNAGLVTDVQLLTDQYGNHYAVHTGICFGLTRPWSSRNPTRIASVQDRPFRELVRAIMDDALDNRQITGYS